MSGSAVPAAASEPTVAQGICYVLFAYDVGLSIDLDRAEQRITALTQRARLRHKRRAPRFFDYTPAPLRVIEEVDPLDVGAGFRTTTSVDLVLYDFGAVAVTYQIPLTGPLSALVALSDALYESVTLLADSRQRVAQLQAAIDPSVARPALADFVETYTIFEIGTFTRPVATHELYTTYAPQVAQVLRSEPTRLSTEEVSHATASRISYGETDLALIDWDAALIYDQDADDVRAVLEFANVELLEMRHVDQQLDAALDRSYEVLTRRAGRRLPLLGARSADLQRIGRLQVDSAVLFEGVNNALKLLGDQYLARVYRLASERFHLAEWDATILRKLETLESIYQKLSDAAANWRIELLEWIIILLIAFEIALSFLPVGH